MNSSALPADTPCQAICGQSQAFWEHTPAKQQSVIIHHVYNNKITSAAKNEEDHDTHSYIQALTHRIAMLVT